MNTDIELKNHVLFEFSSRGPNKERILYETRGYIAGIDQVIKALCSKMYRQIEDCCLNGESMTETYAGNIMDDGVVTFFDRYNIILDTKYSQEKGQYRGGLSPKETFSDDDGSVVCCPDIELSITGNDPQKMYETLRFSLGHELTHAYNMFQYARKNGLSSDDIIKNFTETQRYDKIIGVKENMTGNPKLLATTLYYLNRGERNAYIAQLRQELTDRKDELKDSRTTMEAIRSTESYKKFKSLEQNVVALYSPEITEKFKKGFIFWVGRMTEKKFTTYGQARKYVVRAWEAWKKKYLSVASKIAYDIYEKYHPMTYDDSSDNNNTSYDLN